MSDQITQGHSSRKSGGGKEAERGAEEGEQFEGPRSPQGELQTMQEKGVQVEGGFRGASAEFQSSSSSCAGGESAEWPLGVRKGFPEAPDINHLRLPGASPSEREPARLLLS